MAERPGRRHLLRRFVQQREGIRGTDAQAVLLHLHRLAITRNRAVNKQPGLKVTCKHIEGAIAQYGLPMEPLSNEAYVAMIAELQAIREATA